MILTFFSKNKELIYLNLLISLAEPFASGILAYHIDRYSLFATVSFINMGIILPLLLFILNILIPVMKKEFSFSKCFLFTGFGLMLGDLSSYVTWGLTGGMLLHPDFETLAISLMFVIYQCLLLVVLGLIVKICKIGKR